jgi:hypothetical protein
MKTITPNASIRVDSGEAFSTPGAGTPRRTPMWRVDATMGTVLGVASRMTAAQRGSAPNEGSLRNAR